MNKKDRFLYLVFLLVIISAAISFVRYMVFFDFRVYTDESDISESIPDQFNNVLNNGL